MDFITAAAEVASNGYGSGTAIILQVIVTVGVITAAVVSSVFGHKRSQAAIEDTKATLSGDHAEVRKFLTELKVDVHGVKGDVRDVKADMRAVKGELSDVKAEVRVTRNRLADHTARKETA